MTNSQKQSHFDNQASDIRLGGFWGKLPKSCHPYIALMRLDRPTGWWLLVLPSWWAILASAEGARHALWLLWLFTMGAIVMRAAGCIINDLWDRDIDQKIARTASRPLASGEIAIWQALVALLGLGLIGLIILLQLPLIAWAVGIASLPLVACYPLFKRFTFWPQIMLGLTFSWGILLGHSAATSQWPSLAMGIIYAGTVLWVVGYDTIYAIQDMSDDAITGVKSSALALKGRIAFAVKRLYAFCLIILTMGFYLHFGDWGIWLTGIVMMGLHLYRQTSLIDEENPKMALMLFQSNRDAGLFLSAALLAELFL